MKTSQAAQALVLLLWAFVNVGPADSFTIHSTQRQSRGACIMKESEQQEQQLEKVKMKTYNPLRLLVLKGGLTEPAWTSPWNYQKKQVGSFHCAYCGQELFDSSSKYDSGSGWPSFWRSALEGSVRLKKEWDGRVECSCSKCKSHLGHVFSDGPRRESVDATLLNTIPASDPKARSENARLPRFCVNGASLKFEKKEA